MAYIAWFDEIGKNDVLLVGGKNASLGEMYKNLSSKGIRVPYGFAVTTDAYKYFIEKAGIKNEIEELLKDIDAKDVKKLMEYGNRIREMIEKKKREILERMAKEELIKEGKLKKEFFKNV